MLCCVTNLLSFLLFCLCGTNIGYKHYKWLKGHKFCLGCHLQSATKDYTTRPLSRKGGNQHNTTKDKIVGQWKINISVLCSPSFHHVVKDISGSNNGCWIRLIYVPSPPAQYAHNNNTSDISVLLSWRDNWPHTKKFIEQ